MALDTDISLRNKIIYSIYVRNYSESGDFKGVIYDMDRIKSLGVDIIWLMPIHPIGEINRKGKLGCPYSIKDYRGINTEYGTLDDFKKLIEEVHVRGMKIIIDVVYNHTSYDSALSKKHIEWFYRNNCGKLGSKIGDWSDIMDLDYDNKELWDYQIETLKYWINIGVDGFRCDVGYLVPIEFWIKARNEIKKLNKDAIWLCETAGAGFVTYLRKNGILCHSDSEMYNAFDINYDYDGYEFFMMYLKGEITLEDYLEKKREQEYVYPQNYVKLRFLENHDNTRASKLFKDEKDLKNWTAFSFFEKGAELIYAGEEVRDDNRPSLFYKDNVNWNNDRNFENYIKKLISIKKKDIFSIGNYKILKSSKKGIVHAEYCYKNELLTGIFNVERKIGEYEINLKDGTYINLINDNKVQVKNNKINIENAPIIIESKKEGLKN